MRILRYTILALVPVGIIAGGYWWSNRPPAVTVTEPFRGSAAEIVYATAIVEPENWAKVTPLIRERIIALCDCEGKPIKKDDVLAELDAGDARATLSELEARQQLAKSDRERAFELLERKVISQHIYDKADSQLIQINALILAQTERLRDYTILAPMDGVVLRQDGSVGEVTAPGDILFWIGQPRPLQLVAEVNEEDIPRVQRGQDGLVNADAFPDDQLPATVNRITPKGDPILKNYRVYLDLPEDTPLRIGMSVELNIVTRKVDDTLLVPVAALNDADLFVVDRQNRLSRQTVKIGIRGTRHAQIIDGLPEGATIVSAFSDDLRNGQRIEPVREVPN